METVVQSQSQGDEELQLLLDWDLSSEHARWRKAGAISVGVHLAAILGLMLAPRDSTPPKPVQETRRITPLVAPPKELTQRTPNKGKISKSFNVEALLPRPKIQLPPSPPSTTRAAAPVPAIPAPQTPVKPSTVPVPEPPKIETAREIPPKLPDTTVPLASAPPQIQPVEKPPEKPKLAFENPGGQPGDFRGQGIAKPAPVPGSSVNEALRNLAHGGSTGGITVGDAGAGPGGIGEAIHQAPSPGKQASALELLSDPMGVDFRPYLLQILSTVRRNWFAVMPESAKLGRRGNVALQFAIGRDGSVLKIVFASNSGADSLDRAAVASISMSHPFPPLPPEFRGNQIRLQFTFQYNSVK
jgi:TonB family protein